MKLEFQNMWADLIDSPGDIEAIVASGQNEGKAMANGSKKGAINFASGKGVKSKVFL